MTKFKLDRYDVLVQHDDGVREHQVTIYHADELFAEREGPKYGLGLPIGADGEADPTLIRAQHMQTLQVWAVLKRSGQYDKPFANFMNTDCLALQAAEDLVLDPTQPEDGTPSPSPSVTTGHPSPTGSTPTSTTA